MLTNALISALVSIPSAILTYYLNDLMRLAKLEMDDELMRETFTGSVRVSLAVNYKSGRLPARNVIGYLTIKASNASLADFIVGKHCGMCELANSCNKCGGKFYLANPNSKQIVSEPLPWSVPIEFGKGLEGLDYKHATYIPVKGRAILRLFDIYRYDSFYLVKVHSEYGTEVYPRVCLKLPLNIGSKEFALEFEVAIAGENLRNSPKATLIIKPGENDYVMVYKGGVYPLNKLFSKSDSTTSLK